MQIAMKSVAVLTVSVALGISSNALASETGDSSLEALKQEVAELRQMVTELTKYIKNLETRFQTLERAVSRRENPNELLFPFDSVIGTWLDDEEMRQKRIERLFGDHSIHPIEVEPRR